MTISEQIADLKQQRDALDKRIADLEGEGGKVAAYADSVIAQGESTIGALEIASLVANWEKFKTAPVAIAAPQKG
jgi:hypothetical protein